MLQGDLCCLAGTLDSAAELVDRVEGVLASPDVDPEVLALYRGSLFALRREVIDQRLYAERGLLALQRSRVDAALRVVERVRGTARDPQLLPRCREIRAAVADATRNHEREEILLVEAVSAFERYSRSLHGSAAGEGQREDSPPPLVELASLPIPMGTVDSPATVAEGGFAQSRDRVTE